MTSNNIYYVYVLFRASGAPCYVGKGKGKRWLSHSRKTHNPILARIAAKDGIDLPSVIVRACLSESEAFETEKALIKAIGRLKDDGPLVNLTDGGEGVSGFIQTPEQIERLRISRTGRKHTDVAKEKVRAAFAGKPKSAAHCAAVSTAKKGKRLGVKPSAETRAKMSEVHRKRYALVTPEQRTEWGLRAKAAMTDETRALKSARITAALTGKKLSAEHRASISRVQMGRPGRQMTPEQRAALSAAKNGILRGPMSPEALAARRAKMAAKRGRPLDIEKLDKNRSEKYGNIELPLAKAA